MTDFTLMAGNNRRADARLHDTCARPQPGALEAPRTGVFPALWLTHHHIHAIGLHYLDTLTESGLRPRAFRDAPAFATVRDLAAAQATPDNRPIAFCRKLSPDRATRTVITDRGAKGRVPERIDRLLLRLFPHRVHHRGQAHASLSGTSTGPPQPDDFFLDFERDPAAMPFIA